MDGVVEAVTPTEVSVGIDLIGKTFSVRISFPSKTVTVTPTARCLEVHIYGMTAQVIRVRGRGNDSASNILTLFSESMSDLNSDRTLPSIGIHSVHMSYEPFINLNF